MEIDNINLINSMRKVIHLLTLILLFFVQIGYLFPVSTKAVEKLNNSKQMDMKIIISPCKSENEGSQTVIHAGESFTLDVTVTNNTYMEEYGPKDIKLTNPHAAVDFGDCGNYISPSMARWELYLGSMENTQIKTFNKTFTTNINFPLSKCTPVAMTWTDKDDPNTLDVETQIYPPIKILPVEKYNDNTQEQEESQEGEEDQSTYMNEAEDDDTSESFLTTTIDTTDKEQLREVKDFTIEEKDKNKVQFKNTFDFSDDETISKLNELDKHVDFSTIGKVMVDSEFLDMLEGEAIVTMYNLPFETTPTIYKDDRPATEGEVNNITYIYSETEQSGTLVFEVSGFSTYVAKLAEIIPDSTEGEIKNPLHKSLLVIGIVTVQGMIAVFLVKLIARERKMEHKNTGFRK